MPSPFPGMNPYLEHEDSWRDFHGRFLPAAADWLSAQVDPEYIVKLEENVYIHERSAAQRQLLGYADLAVSEQTPSTAGTAVATTPTAAPAQLLLPRVDVVREQYLEVRERRSRRLVTVLELLSPTNKKAGEDRESYIRKRTLLFRSQAHFIEIDFLRGLPRMPYVELPDHDYYALVSRVESRPRVDLWPIRLREPLPKIPVPLTEPHPDAELDLQAVLHRVYDAARYASYIYTHEPQPALRPEDAVWARALLPVAS